MRKSPQDAALIRSSAAEYLTYIAAAGDDKDSIEMRYEDENIWLTQKMLAALYGVSIAAINQHIKKIFADRELEAKATIKKFLTTAKIHAETEFEKYRIIQDRLYISDFDQFIEEHSECKGGNEDE